MKIIMIKIKIARQKVNYEDEQGKRHCGYSYRRASDRKGWRDCSGFGEAVEEVEVKANEKESAFMVINMPIVSIITVAISAIKKLKYRRTNEQQTGDYSVVVAVDSETYKST